MDPISTAIISAVANQGATAVKDAYVGLKSLFIRKFGSDSKVVDAIQSVEDQPESEGRKLVLAEEVAATRASEDQELLRAIEKLRTAVEVHGREAVSVQQSVYGNRNVFSGTGDVTVHHLGPETS
jgi:hypothetical protein